MEAFDGGSSRAGDHILEGAWVEAGFEDHTGGAEEGLGGEAGGDIAGEAGGDGAIAEGFDDLVAVGGSATAEAGDGIEEGFGDLDGDAD